MITRNCAGLFASQNSMNLKMCLNMATKVILSISLFKGSSVSSCPMKTLKIGPLQERNSKNSKNGNRKSLIQKLLLQKNNGKLSRPREKIRNSLNLNFNLKNGPLVQVDLLVNTVSDRVELVNAIPKAAKEIFQRRKCSI